MGCGGCLDAGEDSRYSKVCPGYAANRWWPVEGSGSLGSGNISKDMRVLATCHVWCKIKA